MKYFKNSLRTVAPVVMALSCVLVLSGASDAEAKKKFDGGGSGDSGWSGASGSSGDSGWSGAKGGHGVPELDPGMAGGALIVLLGGAFMVIDRRRKAKPTGA